MSGRPQLNLHVVSEPEDGKLTERLFIAISPDMLQAVEDYFHTYRFRSQSAAARQLLEYGLEQVARGDKARM